MTSTNATKAVDAARELNASDTLRLDVVLDVRDFALMVEALDATNTINGQGLARFIERCAR